MILRTLFAMVLALSLSLVAHAAPTIVAGNHILLPNTPNQTIEVTVTGVSPADAFLGVDLYLTVADGSIGPVITAVDVVGAGTVFAGNNFGLELWPSVRRAQSRDRRAHEHPKWLRGP